MASSDRGVSSFGRRRPEEKVDEPTVLSVQLPPVPVTLEVDRQSLLALGDAVRETVYNATMAGLREAVEDFADAQDPDGEADRQAEREAAAQAAGDGTVMNTTGEVEPVLTSDQLRQVGDTDSR